MLLDIRRMFSRYDGPVHCEETVSMEGEDFPGYTIEGPVHAAFCATLHGAVLQLECSLHATVRFECARCLAPCHARVPHTGNLPHPRGRPWQRSGRAALHAGRQAGYEGTAVYRAGASCARRAVMQRRLRRAVPGLRLPKTVFLQT